MIYFTAAEFQKNTHRFVQKQNTQILMMLSRPRHRLPVVIPHQISQVLHAKDIDHCGFPGVRFHRHHIVKYVDR